MRVASRRRRLLARLVDWGWLAAVSVGLVDAGHGFVPGPGEMVRLQLLLAIVFVGVGASSEIVLLKIWGRTPGKALLRLRVVGDGDDRQALTWSQCVWRVGGRLLNMVLLGTGHGVGLWDLRRRTLPDLLAQTRVVSL